MNAPIIAFFNAKRGVGTTSTVYHLAWMFSDLGVKVLAVDLDPQASLTQAFFGPHISLEDADGTVDNLNDTLVLAPAYMKLAEFEEELAIQWQQALGGDERAFRAVSKPWRVMTELATQHDVQLVLVDLGPNLSAINRSGLIAADWVVVVLEPEVISVLGIAMIGAALRKWRDEWQQRLARRPAHLELPAGEIIALGYVVQQNALSTMVNTWILNIPEYYRRYIRGESQVDVRTVVDDPNKLAVFRPYPSLSAMAREAGKPMFHLKPADGALGAHLQAAEDARKDFEALAKAIVAKANLPISFAR